MTDSLNAGVHEVAAEPAEVVAQEADSTELQNVSDVIDKGLDSNNDQDKNWRALREKHERLQKEFDETSKRSREYEELLFKIAQQQQQTSSPEPEEEQLNIQPDDWLTYEQFEKLNEKRTKRLVQQALDEDRRKRADEELPQRLSTQYPDFNSVVTEDNVKQLKALEPEVASALNRIDDKYAQAVAAYKYIKKLVPDAAEQTEFKQRVEKNSKRPGSLSSVSSSSLSQAQGFEKGLTPEVKAQLFREMQEASRRS